MLQHYYIFVQGMAGTKLYRQISAALLLLLLALTTVVQLTHTHAVKQTVQVQLKKQLPEAYHQNISEPGAGTKCFVHEYQLTKDADLSISVFQPTRISFALLNTAAYKTPLTTARCSNFENRGPPAGFINAV